MKYKRTAGALAVAAIIAAAMVTMTAMADKEANQEATETATAETTEAVPELQAETMGAYRGIEPDTADPPERTGFIYRPEIGLDEKTQDFIFVEASEAGIDDDLALAVIIYEHRGHPDADAVSATADYGLMQINECNHAWLSEKYGLTDMTDAQQNIIAGIAILTDLATEYDDGTKDGLNRMLMAYNMGRTGMEKAWEAGTHSTEYSRSVIQIMEDVKAGAYSAGNFDENGDYTKGE